MTHAGCALAYEAMFPGNALVWVKVMAVWVVRGGTKCNDYSGKFCKAPAVVIGYGVGDLSGSIIRDELKAKASQAYPYRYNSKH